MPIPRLTSQDVAQISPDIQNVCALAEGGQKKVFSCEISGRPYVIKFILVEELLRDNGQEVSSFTDRLNEVIARAIREVDTMEQIDTQTLVKPGPIRLNQTEINGQRVIYFTEEKIEGKDLKAILSECGTLSIDEIKRLGYDIVTAIECLWQIRRIHRDIKPGNIMLRSETGRFMLLDMGIVFDLGDISLTPTPFIMGTLGYLSPEQLIYSGRRALDFRSDLFSLGVVLYEAATGINPFIHNCASRQEILTNIQNLDPQKPSVLRSDIPEKLDDIILRMIRKQPHLRYNSCSELKNTIQAL